MPEVYTDLKQLYPDVPDEEIYRGVAEVKQQNPTVTDSNIVRTAQEANVLEAPSMEEFAAAAEPTPLDMIKGLSSPENIAALQKQAGGGASWLPQVLSIFPKMQGAAQMFGSMQQGRANRAQQQLSDIMKMQENERAAGFKERELKLAEDEGRRKETEFEEKHPKGAAELDSAMTAFGQGLVSNMLEQGGMKQLAEQAKKMNLNELGYVAEKFNLKDQYLQQMQNYRAGLEAQGNKYRQADINDRQFNTLVDAGRRRLESNTKAFRDSLVTADDMAELSRLMKEGNTVAAATYAAKYARGIAREVGVLTEGDLTRYTNSRQLARRLADKMSTYLRGTPTQFTMQELDTIVQALDAKSQKHIQSFANQEIERMAKSTGRSTEEISDYLGYSYDPSVPSYGRKKQQQAAQPQDQSDSQVQDSVNVILPNGKPGLIPKDKLDSLLKAGGKLR